MNISSEYQINMRYGNKINTRKRFGNSANVVEFRNVNKDTYSLDTGWDITKHFIFE